MEVISCSILSKELLAAFKSGTIIGTPIGKILQDHLHLLEFFTTILHKSPTFQNRYQMCQHEETFRAIPDKDVEEGDSSLENQNKIFGDIEIVIR